MGFGVFFVRVVTVVRAEQWRAEFAGDVEQRAQHRDVFFLAVVLQLDEEVLAPEDVLEAGRGFERGVVLALQDELRHEPTETAARRGDAFVIPLEQLPVAAGLVVVALEDAWLATLMRLR